MSALQVRVLIVDDDDAYRGRVIRSLGEHPAVDARSVEAGDVGSARALLSDEPFDVVLLDHRLPGMDGLDLLRWMQDARIRVPVVVLTGASDHAAPMELMKAGATDYLPKDRAGGTGELAERVVRVVRDRRVLQELHESLERLRAAVQGTGIGIWELDPESQTVHCDPRCREILGLDEEETLDLPRFYRSVGVEHRDTLRDAVERATSGVDPEPLQLDVRVPGDEERWASLSAEAASGGSGGHPRPVRLTGTVVDSTGRRRAAETLREAGEAQKLLAEASRLMGETLEVGATLERLLDLLVPRWASACALLTREDDGGHHSVWRPRGIVPEETAGSDDPLGLESLLGDDEGRVFRLDERALDRMAGGDGRLRTRLEDQGWRSGLAVELRLGGERAGILALFHAGRVYGEGDLILAEEVGRRIASAIQNSRYYDEATGARERAEAVVKARDDMLAVVTHDLRNPLSAILVAAEALENDPPPALRRRQLDLIVRAGHRLEELINDLLDAARMDAGRFDVDMEPVSLRGLLHETVELFEPGLDGDGCEIDLVVDPDVPAVRCDRRRIHQVVSNLLANAVKHGSGGERIEVGARADGGEVVIWVADQGPGIAEDQVDRIFDRFWKGGGPGAGAGLGLAIARGIVEAHGGRIWAESVPGDRATMYFTLQRAEA